MSADPLSKDAVHQTRAQRTTKETIGFARDLGEALSLRPPKLKAAWRRTQNDGRIARLNEATWLRAV